MNRSSLNLVIGFILGMVVGPLLFRQYIKATGQGIPASLRPQADAGETSEIRIYRRQAGQFYRVRWDTTSRDDAGSTVSSATYRLDVQPAPGGAVGMLQANTPDATQRRRVLKFSPPVDWDKDPAVVTLGWEYAN